MRCPEKAPGLLGLLGERVNLFLSQIQEGRKELMRVAPHIDIIAHNLPGGLLCCAEDFELRFVSDGMLRLLRCSREEITGRYGNNWKNIVHPDDFAFTVAHLDEQRKIQPEYRLSYRIQRADGSSCWVMESSRLTVNADGVPEYVCIIIDDTEQKIIENRRIAVGGTTAGHSGPCAKCSFRWISERSRVVRIRALGEPLPGSPGRELQPVLCGIHAGMCPSDDRGDIQRRSAARTCISEYG